MIKNFEYVLLSIVKNVLNQSSWFSNSLKESLASPFSRASLSYCSRFSLAYSWRVFMRLLVLSTVINVSNFLVSSSSSSSSYSFYASFNCSFSFYFFSLLFSCGWLSSSWQSSFRSTLSWNLRESMSLTILPLGLMISIKL